MTGERRLKSQAGNIKKEANIIRQLRGDQRKAVGAHPTVTAARTTASVMLVIAIMGGAIKLGLGVSFGPSVISAGPLSEDVANSCQEARPSVDKIGQGAQGPQATLNTVKTKVDNSAIDPSLLDSNTVYSVAKTGCLVATVSLLHVEKGYNYFYAGSESVDVTIKIVAGRGQILSDGELIAVLYAGDDNQNHVTIPAKSNKSALKFQSLSEKAEFIVAGGSIHKDVPRKAS